MMFAALHDDEIYVLVDCDADGFTSAAIIINYLYTLYKDIPEVPSIKDRIHYILHTGKQHGLEDCADQFPDNCLIILPDSSTNDTGITLYTNSFLNNSGNKNSFDSNKNNINENKNTIYENKNTIYENNNIQEYYFEPNVDIYKVLSLEDRRTTIMIKNIPNKFNRAILLSTIDINFKGTYDLFILPTDGNRNKNFGYSFINFTSSYFIPYFYFMFNNKKWSSTNSKKICEITYSKVQGRDNLISYYANKIIYFNNVKEVNSEQKYIIPNDYKNLFVQLFPNQIIEEYPFYFTTKIPT